MSLYDVNGGKIAARLIPANGPDSEHVAALRRVLPKASFDRIVKTVEETVEQLVRRGGGRFVWTRMAALFGHNSPVAHHLLMHLRTKVEAVMGDGKDCNIAIGCLLRDAIARRPERHWNLWTTKTDELDADTGKEITINTYWIDLLFVPPRGPFTPADLAAKFRGESRC